MNIIRSVGSYVESQSERKKTRLLGEGVDAGFPAITISRQTGARGRVISEKLCQYLNAADKLKKNQWTVFDRNLVEKALEEHHLPKRLAKYIPEDKTSEISGLLGEVLGLHPSLWTLQHQVSETLLKLARMGNVILIGRGANIVAAGLKNAIHIRFVGSKEKCALEVSRREKISLKEAKVLIQKKDRGRKRFIKTHFNENIDEIASYNLIINTDNISDQEAVRIVAYMVKKRTRTFL